MIEVVCAFAFVCGLSIALSEVLRPRPPLRGPPGPRPAPRPPRENPVRCAGCGATWSGGSECPYCGRAAQLKTGLFTSVTEEEFHRGHPGVPLNNPFDPPLPEPRRRRRRSYWVEPDDMEDDE